MPPPPKRDADDPTTEAGFRALVAGAGRWHTVNDLVALLGGGQLGVSRLVHGYVRGWLTDDDARLLEEHDARLHCWLLARILRALLEPPA